MQQVTQIPKIQKKPEIPINSENPKNSKKSQ